MERVHYQQANSSKTCKRLYSHIQPYICITFLLHTTSNYTRRRCEKSGVIYEKDIFSIIIAFIIQFHFGSMCVCESYFANSLIESEAANTELYNYPERSFTKFQRRKASIEKANFFFYLFGRISFEHPYIQQLISVYISEAGCMTYGNANE